MPKTPGGRAVTKLGQPLKLPPMPSSGATVIPVANAAQRDLAERRKTGIRVIAATEPAQPKK
jgi:hypothetical protein